MNISVSTKPSTASRPKSVAITPKRTPLAPYNINTTGHETYRWNFLRSLAGDTPSVKRHPDSTRYLVTFSKKFSRKTRNNFFVKIACVLKMFALVSFCRYIRDFKKHKEELTARLFKLFNETVFENKVHFNATYARISSACTLLLIIDITNMIFK